MSRTYIFHSSKATGRRPQRLISYVIGSENRTEMRAMPIIPGLRKITAALGGPIRKMPIIPELRDKSNTPAALSGGQELIPVKNPQPLQSIENTLAYETHSQQDKSTQAIMLTQSKPETVIKQHLPAIGLKSHTILRLRYPSMDDILNLGYAVSLRDVDGSTDVENSTITRGMNARKPMVEPVHRSVNLKNLVSLRKLKIKTDTKFRETNNIEEWRLNLMGLIKNDVDFMNNGLHLNEQFKDLTEVEIRNLMVFLQHTMLLPDPFEFLAAKNAANINSTCRSESSASESIASVQLNIASSDERRKYVNKYCQEIPMNLDHNENLKTGGAPSLNRFKEAEDIFKKYISQFEFIDLLDM